MSMMGGEGGEEEETEGGPPGGYHSLSIQVCCYSMITQVLSE